MKHSQLFFGILVCSILFSCSTNPSDNKQKNQMMDSVATETQSSTDSHHHAEILVLHNGVKWRVNSEMQPFILKGETLVNDYISHKDSNFVRLASDLKSSNNALIKSCTMKGEAHENLHKWLHPHLKLVDALGKCTNDSLASLYVDSLQQSYSVYHQYFN